MRFFSGLGGKVLSGPLIFAADFAHLEDNVRKTRDGGAEFVHFDTMDNHFVPNLSIGPLVAASPIPNTDLPVVDTHLIVENPDNLISLFLNAGVASISVHPEAVTHRPVRHGAPNSPTKCPSVRRRKYVGFVRVIRASGRVQCRPDARREDRDGRIDPPWSPQAR